ncbi:MAG: hypothetical protein ACE5G3_10470 [Gammaproteobacteria bacterium]
MTRSYRHRNSARLVLRNLAPNANAELLNAMLEGHGEVRSVKLMTDVMTGRCSGVAYVTLDEFVVGSARASLDGSLCDGRVIRVSVEQKPWQSAGQGAR